MTNTTADTTTTENTENTENTKNTETTETIETPTITKTKKIQYKVNGEKQIKTIEMPLTNEEKIKARINALRLLVATGKATQQDREDLDLLAR